MRLSIPSFYTLAVLLTAVTTQPVLAADHGVGMRKISVVSPTYSRALAVSVWYPSKGDGEAVTIGGNRIFEGVSVSKNAGIAAGRHPLVLLSHGSGSRADGMGWIAVELARAGFIVAGPNHPGTTSGDSTPAATPKIWERAQDISQIITHFSASSQWQGAIDPARIGVLGFSLGGMTGLELAGARAELDAFADYCNANPDQFGCAWFLGTRGFADGEQVTVEPLKLEDIDRRLFEQSNRDPRIRSAVLVDPGYTMAFDTDSITAIDIPLTYINLGSEGEIPEPVLADVLANRTPDAAYAQVDKSDHFSFLPVCKPGAADFLKSLGEGDPICGETARPRGEIHDELTRIIVDAFERDLKAAD